MKKTEQLLIDVTFDILYKNGYCATSLMDILRIAKVTKGAVYYHFENKNSLVLASIQYYLEYILQSHWIEPLEKSDKPVEIIIKQTNAYLAMFEDKKSFLDVKHGCPLINFVLDMSDKDKECFKYLQSVYSRWQESIEKALTKAQILKQTKTDFKAKEEALFIISSIEGCIGTSKAYNNIDVMKQSFQVLTKYIQKL